MKRVPIQKIVLIATAGILVLRLATLFMPVPTYAKMYSKQAAGYEENNKIDLAIEYYKKAIYHDPAYPRPYCRLGIIYGAKGDEKKKQEYFRKVVQLAPMEREYARAYSAIGAEYFEKGDYQSAINYLKKAHALDENLPEVYYYLGASYYNIGDKELALQQEKLLYTFMQGSTASRLGGQPWREKLADLLDLQL